ALPSPRPCSPAASRLASASSSPSRWAGPVKGVVRRPLTVYCSQQKEFQRSAGMAIVMFREWDVTPDQYEAARKLVNWEGQVPAGAIFHVAAFNQRGLRVTDLWESEEDMQAFVNTRLMPGVRQLGIQSNPH